MAEVDLERLVLPALLALLVLGAFMILVTSGGSEPRVTPTEPVSRSAPATAPKTEAKTEAKTAPAATNATNATNATVVTERRFIKVDSGETAASVAGRAGITQDRLLSLNPSINPSSLRTGQILKIAP